MPEHRIVRTLADLRPGDYIEHPVIGGMKVASNWQAEYEEQVKAEYEPTPSDQAVANALGRVREFLKVVPIGRPHVGDGSIANVSGLPGGSLTIADIRTLADATDRAPSIDAAHIEHQRAWSTATFGPRKVRGPLGPLAHIRKELDEVADDPHDLEEWVDVIILGYDGAWRAGHEPQAIIDAIKAKQAKNESREWPDWRGVPADQAIEHVRPTDTSTPSDQELRDLRAGVEARDRIARVLYEEHFDREDDDWLSTTDGSPNSASYALADRILASFAPATASEGTTEAPVGPTGHRWPCRRFYILSSKYDVCTCEGGHTPTVGLTSSNAATEPTPDLQVPTDAATPVTSSDGDREVMLAQGHDGR